MVKKPHHSFLSFAYKISNRSGSAVSRRDVLTAMLDVFDRDGRVPLHVPKGVTVLWGWRNGPRLPMRFEDIRTVATDSSVPERGAYNILAANRIRNDLKKLGARVPARKFREAAKSKKSRKGHVSRRTRRHGGK